MMFRFLRRKDRNTQRSTKRHRFQGVSVAPSRHFVCHAALALEGERFLADEAPPLPLDGCADPRSCRCVYQHFKDRRTGFRRDSDDGLPIRDHANDIRSGKDRRITDD